MAPSSPTAEWAQFYSKANWRTFPVWAGKKNPIYEGWQSGATTDPTLIDRYFSDPERNIGVVCGEQFDAWDIEVEHVDTFNKWVESGGHALPESPIASTGRGGIHILTQPTGVDGTRYLYLGGKHIGELKSRGGYILVCPSVTEEMYQWTWLPRRAGVQPAPEWLLGLLERPQTVKRLPTRLATPDDVVAVLGRLAGSVAHSKPDSHHRNAYLYWAMRRATEEGVPVHHAKTALTVAGREAGLDAHEVWQTIESALKAESVPV